MTHVELLDLDTRPQHLLILVGGYIALELAQAMARLGTRVTVCEKAERLLMREDPDIAAAVTAALTAEGITIVTGADVDRVSGRSGERVALHGTIGGAAGQVIEGTHLLVALGKEPNTKGIGLDRGWRCCDPSRLRHGHRSTRDNGDTCVGIVRDNLAGENRKTTGRQALAGGRGACTEICPNALDFLTSLHVYNRELRAA